MVVVGSLLALALRYQAKSSKPIEAEYESSAEKFRYEMQRSADEVIARMSERIDRLEKLVEEADERSAQLEWQLARLNDSDRSSNYGSIETEPSPETDDGFSNMLEKSLEEEDISVASGSIQTVRAINAYQSAPVPQPEEYVSVEESAAMEETEDLSVEAVEEETEDVTVKDYETATDYDPFPESSAADGDRSIEIEEDPVISRNNELKTAMVKQLIQEGFSTEDIAKRVHLGRIAVDLIRQMKE